MTHPEAVEAASQFLSRRRGVHANEHHELQCLVNSAIDTAHKRLSGEDYVAHVCEDGGLKPWMQLVCSTCRGPTAPGENLTVRNLLSLIHAAKAAIPAEIERRVASVEMPTQTHHDGRASGYAEGFSAALTAVRAVGKETAP